MGSYERPTRASDGRNMSTNAPMLNSASGKSTSNGRQTTRGMAGVKKIGTASVSFNAANLGRLVHPAMGHKGPTTIAKGPIANNDTGGDTGRENLSDSRQQTPLNPKDRYAGKWKKA